MFRVASWVAQVSLTLMLLSPGYSEVLSAANVNQLSFYAHCTLNNAKDAIDSQS